jgi:hypothetical protein
MIPVADTQLAEQYGVPVSVITHHREKVLTQGVHWEKDNKRVLWLAKGLAAVAEMVAALQSEKKERGAGEPSGEAASASLESGQGDPATPETEEPPDPPEAPGPLPLRTAQARVLLKHPNPCFVRCHIPGDKATPPFDLRLRNHHTIKGKNALLPVAQLADGTWICTHPHHSPRPYV